MPIKALAIAIRTIAIAIAIVAKKAIESRLYRKTVNASKIGSFLKAPKNS